MYRQGRYYRPKRHFPLFPREAIIAAAILLVGAAGLGSVLAIHQHADESSDRISSRGRNYSRRQPSPPPSPPPAAEPTLPKVKSTDSLSDPNKKEVAMRLVSSAENSSLDWQAQYAYIEDIGDGRGYTAGIIGFCSGTGDMLVLVQDYAKAKPNNPLAQYLPALKAVNGSASHAGLGNAFVAAWKTAAADPVFQKAQDSERDTVYFNPAVKLAKQDGLGVLGQFMYYDAAVMHGPDAWGGGLPDLRDRAISQAKPPSQGGDQVAYLKAFLAVREAEMAKDSAHRDISRITAELSFLNAGNLNLDPPLSWTMYGDPFSITVASLADL